MKEYLIAFGVFILVIIALKIFKQVIIVKIKKFADHTKTEFDDLLIKTVDCIGWPFCLFFSLYFAFKFIIVPQIIVKHIILN